MNLYSLFEEVYDLRQVSKNVSMTSISDDVNIEVIENLIKVELNGRWGAIHR